MSRTAPKNWKEIVADAKSEPRPSTATVAPATVSRIVGAASRQRREWILNLWKSFAFRAVLVGLAATAAAALSYWIRYRPAPDPPITPLPRLEQFPDATISP